MLFGHAEPFALLPSRTAGPARNTDGEKERSCLRSEKPARDEGYRGDGGAEGEPAS